MAQEVKVPKLGDNISEAEVVNVLVNIGESISAGQSLIELESDKASVEVPSTAAGVIKEMRVSPGDKVKEDQVILILEASGSASSGDDAGQPQNPQQKQGPDTQEAQAVQPAQAEPAAGGAAAESKPAAEPKASAPAAEASLEVKVPKLGDNVKSADITQVLVAVGDSISAGQSLIELESEKASVEVPSPYAGTVESLAVKEGDSVSEDQLILVLKGSGSQASAAAPEQSGDARRPPHPHVAEAQGQDEPAQAQEKSQAQAAEKPAAQAAEPAKPAQPGPATLGDPAPAAPSVRRFARELGVDIHTVKGSGPGGRISKDDVKLHVKTLLKAPPAAAAGPAQAIAVPDMPDFSKYGEIKAEKISNVRRATARQMSLSWSQIPHVTQFDHADITEIETFRKTQAKKVEAAGGKLTVTAILLKLCALALKRFPQFNASIDLKNEQIIFKQYCHIGVAVDTPRGLVVPVIRDVDKKGLIALAVELGETGKKARDKKLSPDDMSGAGFTISNLGGLGTTYFTPIVNWPEVAILGVGRASNQPVWKDNAFVPRMIMPLSISYDHRLIDGADAARFLRFIAEALENPLSLLME